ncbi:uncharacterized protein LOC107854411 [Capsicum annuum]|uniref:uncharacterized protein LOC107854411 n=1 Tax=Capsicum annuum TaxID=4072 RepID=UPI001FB16423|nr:uncharacterized protein LOC107854411 [Capsicum annuum]
MCEVHFPWNPKGDSEIAEAWFDQAAEYWKQAIALTLGSRVWMLCLEIVVELCSELVGLDGVEKLWFWEVLDEVVRGVPSSEKIVVAGDFNRHIGLFLGGFDNVYGSFSFRERNDKGAAHLDFVRKEDKVLCKDCKVISNENLSTQHRLLVMDLGIKRDKKRRHEEGRPRIK